MKKPLMIGLVVVNLMIFSGCGEAENVANESENKAEEIAAEKTGPVPFADINMDVMDAYAEYKISFTKGEGNCMDQGFPTNLVYGPKINVIKTEDEKYVEDMTAVDFTGTIRFDQVPLSTGSAACVVKTTVGISTANLTCSVKEGEVSNEVCTATFKLTAEKA